MVAKFKAAPSSIKSFIVLNGWMIPLSALVFWGKIRQYDESALTQKLQGQDLTSFVLSSGIVLTLFILMMNALILRKQKIARAVVTLSFGCMIVFYFFKNYPSFLNGEIFSTYNFLTLIIVGMMIVSLVLLYKKDSQIFFDQN